MKNLILILSIFIFGSCADISDKTLEKPFIIIDKQATIYYEYQDKNGQRKTFTVTDEYYNIGDTIK